MDTDERRWLRQPMCVDLCASVVEKDSDALRPTLPNRTRLWISAAIRFAKTCSSFSALIRLKKGVRWHRRWRP